METCSSWYLLGGRVPAPRHCTGACCSCHSARLLRLQGPSLAIAATAALCAASTAGAAPLYRAPSPTNLPPPFHQISRIFSGSLASLGRALIIGLCLYPCMGLSPRLDQACSLLMLTHPRPRSVRLSILFLLHLSCCCCCSSTASSSSSFAPLPLRLENPHARRSETSRRWGPRADFQSNFTTIRIRSIRRLPTPASPPIYDSACSKPPPTGQPIPRPPLKKGLRAKHWTAISRKPQTNSMTSRHR